MQGGLENTLTAIAIQRLASNRSDQRASSIFSKQKPFDNVSVSASSKFSNSCSEKKKQIKSFMRKMKKKLHLKTKEKESEKIIRSTLVEEVTQNSYHVQLKSLVCLL